jgi:hypothetical protein
MRPEDARRIAEALEKLAAAVAAGLADLAAALEAGRL